MIYHDRAQPVLQVILKRQSVAEAVAQADHTIDGPVRVSHLLKAGTAAVWPLLFKRIVRCGDNDAVLRDRHVIEKRRVLKISYLAQHPAGYGDGSVGVD